MKTEREIREEIKDWVKSYNIACQNNNKEQADIIMAKIEMLQWVLR